MVNNFVSKGDGEEDRAFWQGDSDFPEASSHGGVPGVGDHDVMCMTEILGQICSQTTLRERKNEKGKELWCGLEHKARQTHAKDGVEGSNVDP